MFDKMKTFNIVIAISFFSNLILIFGSPMLSDSPTTNYSSFVECLETYSLPSNPISLAIFSPQNSSYSSVLQFYVRNLRFSEPTTPKPQFIVTALHVSHVQAAVICAKSHGLQIRIRSGGHDFEGVSYVSYESFIVLDMFNIREINVDVDDETAWIEAGATLGEAYYRIAEKSRVLAFAAGTCPSVGVGGLVSGGGFGNMVRKFGMTVDNIIDAKLVDVNGRFLDRASMGEDLFWAITGGGASSFGVVIAYKTRLVKVPLVTFAAVRFNEIQTELVYKYLQIAHKLHEDIFIKLSLDVQKSTSKTVRGTFLILFIGNTKHLLSILQENIPELGVAESDCVESSWVESLLRWTNFPKGTPINALLSRYHPAPVRQKRKSDFLKKPISKNGLESIFNKMKELETPVLKFFPCGGIMSKISPSYKPFPHRAGNIALVEIATNWNETGIDAANHYMNLTRSLYVFIAPFVSESRDAYLNYRDFELGVNYNDGLNSYKEAASFGLKYFKNNFNRLVRIKSKVDPENFFRNEQSIPVLPLRGSA